MPSEGIVFVVDDDVSVRESVAALIATAGLHVAAFDSATSFLIYSAPPGPSCLVLDVSLPDLNGLDLQERIAGERVEMPIIFITALRRCPHDGEGDEGWSSGISYQAARPQRIARCRGLRPRAQPEGDRSASKPAGITPTLQRPSPFANARSWRWWSEGL